jgi:hypothetical protein
LSPSTDLLYISSFCYLTRCGAVFLGLGIWGEFFLMEHLGNSTLVGFLRMDCILPSDVYIDQDSHNHSFFTPCMKASELDCKNESTCSNLGLQWSKGGQNCVFLFSKVFRSLCCDDIINWPSPKDRQTKVARSWIISSIISSIIAGATHQVIVQFAIQTQRDGQLTAPHRDVSSWYHQPNCTGHF